MKDRKPLIRDRVLTMAIVVALVLAALIITRAASGDTSIASAYGPGLYGNRMACGGTLQQHTRAVAHRWLPCGTRVRICYAWRCIPGRIRDRGPFVRGRTLDLSEALVRALGYRDAWAWGVRVIVWRTV
jgi:rare lipoprotein A